MGSQCLIHNSSSHYDETGLKTDEHYKTMDYYAIFAAILKFRKQVNYLYGRKKNVYHVKTGCRKRIQYWSNYQNY